MANSQNFMMAEYLFAEGTSLYEQKRFKDAEKKLNQALKHLPDSEEILYNLALVNFELKRYKKAKSILNRIREMDCTELEREIKKAENGGLTFSEFCPHCIYYDSLQGSCSKIHENVRDYPDKFRHKCGGNYYESDSSKVNEPTEVSVSEITDDDSEYLELYETDNLGQLMLIKSVFDDENVDYFTQNEGVFHRKRPIIIFVKDTQLETAKNILDDLLRD